MGSHALDRVSRWVGKRSPEHGEEGAAGRMPSSLRASERLWNGETKKQQALRSPSARRPLSRPIGTAWLLPGRPGAGGASRHEGGRQGQEQGRRRRRQSPRRRGILSVLEERPAGTAASGRRHRRGMLLAPWHEPKPASAQELKMGRRGASCSMCEESISVTLCVITLPCTHAVA